MKISYFFVLLLLAALPAQAASPLYGQLPDDRVMGKDDAPVMIIEYASLSCSHCAHFHKDILPQLEEKYITPGKAKLILRNFPLNEPALRGAQLTLCVPKEKYYTFAKVLFSMQEKWAFDANFLGSLKTIAQVGGVTPEAFDACMADKAIEETVLNTRQKAGDELMIESTPTFFINGQKLQGAGSLDGFAKVIDPLLSAK